MQDAIRAECIRLATMGIACHWLWPKDKAPIGKGWAARGYLSPLCLARTYRAGMNFGIHTGRVANAALSVVGVDLDSVDALRWALRNLPESPLRTMTSKGEHWLYRAPSVAVGNRAKLRVDGKRIDIDIRGDGGNLVCAPSVHPSGFVYQQLGQWNEHGLSKLVTFDPSWFPATEPPPAAPLATASAHQAAACRASSHNYRRAEGLLRAMVRKGEVYERGNGQGSKVFTAARICLNDFGLSEAETFALLDTQYNAHCLQPYDEASLRRKVREAATQGRSTTRRYTSGAGR